MQESREPLHYNSDCRVHARIATGMSLDRARLNLRLVADLPDLQRRPSSR